MTLTICILIFTNLLTLLILFHEHKLHLLYKADRQWWKDRVDEINVEFSDYMNTHS